LRHFTDVLKWQQCPLNSRIERALLVAELDKMVAKKSAEPSPESIARANRQRSAAEEAARAMADVEQRAIAVRKNMERLRALREASEAEGARTHVAVPAARKKKRKEAFSR
jgi:hypothetical protein